MDIDYVSLPEPQIIRERLDKVSREDMQIYLKAVYLTASSPIELAGELTSTDRIVGKYTEPLGPHGSDVFLSEVGMPTQEIEEVLGFLQRMRNKDIDMDHVEAILRQKIPVVVFKIRLAKRYSESYKMLALPMSAEFEPWTEQIYKHYKKRENELVFPFSRQKVWEQTHRKDKTFKGLSYTTKKTTVTTSDKFRVVKPAHRHTFGMQALRIVRTDELIHRYSFDPLDLTEFIGVGVTITNMPIRIEASKTNDWWKHSVRKLCKPISSPLKSQSFS